MNPRFKKFLGAVLLLAFVTIYTLFAMFLGTIIVNTQSKMVQLIYYVLAGLAWTPIAYLIIKLFWRPAASAGSNA